VNLDVDVDLSRYGLGAKPFQSSTDPQFLWLGRAHKEILGTLKSGVLGAREQAGDAPHGVRGGEAKRRRPADRRGDVRGRRSSRGGTVSGSAVRRKDEGLLLLTGEVGTGKTILVKALLESLGPEAITAMVMYAVPELVRR
jgi:hypothetical protein